ncbi:MAG TPA: F0F1 ATP synthase subunit A [Bdellovibrionota bacterium]|nr:F0F1 ATP synthase subunit A [Bdellovibrionota bacterium]
MDHGHTFTWLDVIPVLKLIPHQFQHMVGSLIVLSIIALLAFLGNLGLKARPNPIIPPSRFTLVGLWDVVVEKFGNLVISVAGPQGKPFIPLIGSIFIYIFFCNVMGLIPGSITATTYINTNFAVAITVFIFYNYLGFKEHGVGYLKHFTGPMLLFAPLFFVIELIGHFVRPFSLSLRLFGNMTGDHIVLGVFSDLGIKIFHAAGNVHPILQYLSTVIVALIPIPFYALGLFVCFIQAFVFTLLSTVYIALAISHEH